MTNEMIDMMAGDVRFRRRLEAYAEARLSPDLATTSRMRARVLAHAHRHADLARADAALTIVRPGADEKQRARRSATVRKTAISLVSAAALAVAMVGGAAAASQAGGALYEARLFVEQVTLPADPSERAIAELDRLSQRLAEADAAARSGDHAAAAAALAAYERIMAEASTDVLTANDPVAAAAFETGLGRNVELLQALIAQTAISRAVERAIERSGNAIDRVHHVKKPTPAVGGGGGGGGQNGNGNGGDDGNGGAGNGGPGVGPEATGKPPKTPAPKPEATPRPTYEETERPDPTPKPSKTPKPTQGPGQGVGGSEDPQD